MRIGIDARPLQSDTKYRGIGKSLEKLLRSMALPFGDTDNFIFYVDARLPIPPVINLFPTAQIRRVPSPRLGKKRYFRSFMRPYKAAKPLTKDVDVFLLYEAGFGVPTTDVPVVTVFHDAIPLLFRDKEPKDHTRGIRRYKNALAAKMYWGKYRRTLSTYKKSDAIIAISESSKHDFMKYVGGVMAENIYVVSHGVEEKQAAGKPSVAIRKLTRNPYLLYVGGIDIRKNIVGLIKTFYDLKPKFPALKLMVVGQEFSLSDQLNDLGWYAELAKNKSYAKDVITPGFLSDADLAYIYRHAAVFLFPSRYEGFGLPILEAFQSGCPVVAYRNSSITEIAVDAAMLVNDGASLSPATEKLLTDKTLRQQLTRAGLERARQFRYSRTATETYQVLQAVSKTRNSSVPTESLSRH